MMVWVEQICPAQVSQTGQSQSSSPAQIAHTSVEIDRWECQNPSNKGRIAALNPKETL